MRKEIEAYLPAELSLRDLAINGPRPEQYEALTRFFVAIHPRIQAGLSWRNFMPVVPEFEHLCNHRNTLIGWVMEAPIGYKGDLDTRVIWIQG